MKIHFLVISLGFIFSMYAQNTSLKSNSLDLETEAVATLITAEGKNVFVGNILSDNDVFVTVCNEKKERLWSLPIKTSKVEKATSMALAQNGDILIVGTVADDLQSFTDIWLACVSPNGKLKWTKNWGMERQTRIAAIQAMADSNFCLVGYTNNALTKNDGWIAKIRPSGSEIWSKTFGWDKTDEFMACTQRENGNLLLAGFTDSKGAGLKDMLLLEIDTDGAVSWMRVYGKGNSNEEATGVAETPSKQIVLCGRSNEKNPAKRDTDGRILLLDENGKVTWSDIQGGINMDSYFSIACKTESFAIVGTSIPENAINTQAWGIAYSYDGTKLWEKKWENQAYFSHINPTKSGWCISATQEENQKLLANILFLDEKGELENTINSEQLFVNEIALVEATPEAKPIQKEEKPVVVSPESASMALEEEIDDLPQNDTESVNPEEDMTVEEMMALVHQSEKDTSDKHIANEINAINPSEMSKVESTDAPSNEVAMNESNTEDKPYILKKNGDEIEVVAIPENKTIEKEQVVENKGQAKTPPPPPVVENKGQAKTPPPVVENKGQVKRPPAPPVVENKGEVIIAENKQVAKEAISLQEDKQLNSPIQDTTQNKSMVQNVYILGVGISSYKNSKYNIRYAASDAELFSLYMTNMEGNGFGKVNVQIYTDEQAVLDNIQQAIRNIESQSQAEDLICIYLAGRGYYNKEGVPYLMMNDQSESEGSNNTDTTALNLSALVETLQKLKGEKILLTDFFIDPTANYTSINWTQSIENNPIGFLTSITEDEIALEKSEWGHSAFSKKLLEGLSGKADTDQNFFIYFSELTKYMNEEIPLLTNDLQHAKVILSPLKDVMLGVYR